MKEIKNATPPYAGYDKYPRNEQGKILLDRADDGKIIIKRANTITFGDGDLIGLCDGAKISETDWKDLRRGFYLEETDGSRNFHYCIGGSDAGAVLGRSPYATALDVYNAKKFGAEKEINDKNEFKFKYGHCNESLIAEGFSTKSKLTVFKNNTVFFNVSTGFMQANVDFFVAETTGAVSILEIKTTAKESSTYQLACKGQVPPTYYTQAVLHYTRTLSSAFNIVGIYFAVGCNNNLDDIKICHYERDLGGEEILVDAEKRLCDRLHNDDPPKDTASPIMRLEKSGLKQIESKDVAVDLSNSAKSAVAEMLQLDADIKTAKAQLDVLTKRIEELQAVVCESLGEASMSTPFNISGRTYTATFNSYNKETVDKTALKYKHPEVYQDVEIVHKSTYRKFGIKEVKNRK